VTPNGAQLRKRSELRAIYINDSLVELEYNSNRELILLKVD
jgi:hypothetical protein